MLFVLFSQAKAVAEQRRIAEEVEKVRKCLPAHNSILLDVRSVVEAPVNMSASLEQKISKIIIVSVADSVLKGFQSEVCMILKD